MADHGSHARHDRFAVADALGGGALPITMRGCPACGSLYADLLTLQHAVRHAWTPSRPRDLRLSLADAARLQRQGWRRLVAGIGGSRDALTRPLAVSLTGLGLAGLLLAVVPPLSFGSAGAAPVPAEVYTPALAGGPDGSPAASTAPEVPTRPAGPIDVSTRPATTEGIPPRASEPSRPLAPLSVVLVALGAALFAIRRLASAIRPVR